MSGEQALVTEADASLLFREARRRRRRRVLVGGLAALSVLVIGSAIVIATGVGPFSGGPPVVPVTPPHIGHPVTHPPPAPDHRAQSPSPTGASECEKGTLTLPRTTSTASLLPCYKVIAPPLPHPTEVSP